MKHPLAVLALAAAALNVAACTHSGAADLPPGQYENKTSSTNSNGTDTSKDTTTTVGYDSYGNKKAVVKSKTTVDPPGLFNKSTTETDQVIEK